MFRSTKVELKGKQPEQNSKSYLQQEAEIGNRHATKVTRQKNTNYVKS